MFGFGKFKKSFQEHQKKSTNHKLLNESEMRLSLLAVIKNPL